MSNAEDGTLKNWRTAAEEDESTVRNDTEPVDEDNEAEGDFEIIDSGVEELSSLNAAPNEGIRLNLDLGQSQNETPSLVSAEDGKQQNENETPILVSAEGGGPVVNSLNATATLLSQGREFNLGSLNTHDYSMLNESLNLLDGSYTSDDGHLETISSIKKDYERALSLRVQEREIHIKTIDANVEEIRRLRQELKEETEEKERVMKHLKERNERFAQQQEETDRTIKELQDVIERLAKQLEEKERVIKELKIENESLSKQLYEVKECSTNAHKENMESKDLLNQQLILKDSEVSALRSENEKLLKDLSAAESLGTARRQEIDAEVQQKDEQIRKLLATVQEWKQMFEAEHDKLTKELEESDNNNEIIRVLHQQYFESEQTVQAQRAQLKNFEEQVRGYIERGEVNNI